ncbi:MAG: FKBP-type peptidyl-prolyl cis-trans isomerase [Bdellovibrionota bacterium]
MKTKAQIVSFHCILRNRVGQIISSSFNQDMLTQPDASGPLLRGLADGLMNLRRGEKRRISLSAKEAYGFYDPNLVMDISRKKLIHGDDLKVGQEILTQDDDQELRTFRVIRVSPGSVTLDGNHPLAGQDLIFDIEATSARDATPAEIAESQGAPPAKTLH